jgi:hypothetical protein
MTSRAAAVLAFVLGFAALALAPRPAAADEAAGKEHFKTGVDLYDKQDYERALSEFRAAYAELHLYVIKRNIALALRGLHRYAEAIEALEEYLAEGGDKVDSQLREAAEATITEMSGSIGTVRVAIDGHQPQGTPPPPTVLTVDDEVVAPEKAQLPIRVDAGVEHTFRAHSDGFADGVARVTVTPGQRDVPVRLELVPVTVAGMGTLRVHASVPSAVIRVDQGVGQQGDWSGEMRAGPHRVIVEAPGYVRVRADVAVTPNAIIDLPVTMVPGSSLPPPPPPIRSEDVQPPTRPLPPPQRPRPWYGLVGLSLMAETVHLGPGFETPGLQETFSGADVTLKLGRMLSRETNAHWAIEGLLELGGSKASYGDPLNGRTQTQPTIFGWALAPELVYRSGGNFQLLLGGALGVEGQVVDAQIVHADGTQTEHKGSGVGGMALFEIGGELRFRRAFVQLVGFVDVHYDASVTDDTDLRFFNDNPAGRAGLRLNVGLPLF